MKKSIVTIMLIGVLSSILLVGCSGKKAPSPSTQSNRSTVQNVTQSTTQSATQSTTQSSTTANTQSAVSQKGDEDGDGIPDAVEKTYGTNPHFADTDGDGVNDKDDKEPLYTDNLISETSKTALPIEIKDARVEDNATADHLEITVVNKGKEDLSNFDIYYTITDKVDTGKVEGYYQKLDALTIKAGETITLHFDNDLSQPGHYYGNMNGLYGTAVNGLTFSVQLHSKGYQPAAFNVEKAKGTAEVAD